jgi:phage terminase large subunit-like protein
MAKVEQVTIKGKVFTKASIRAMLECNDQWLYRAIVAINAGQTANELACGGTVEDNGIGFNGVDGNIMMSFAAQLNRCGWLSPKQTIIARKKMTKYTSQLLNIARENANKLQRA